ncbi:MAG: RecX family transcriptional regulator [Myxococcota bacterium]|nr:RecX family transcriptional regulator [Myxococcota bacterium]
MIEKRRGSSAKGRRSRDDKERPPRPWTEAALQRAAIHYLRRFMASEARLRSVLARRLRSPKRLPPEDPAEGARWIEGIVAAAKRRGEIDDRRYCEGLWESYSRKGRSRRQILAKLSEKGIPAELIEAESQRRAEADEAADLNPDLVAAHRYAKQKRLGAYGEVPADSVERRQRWNRDLARLARRGFSFQVARAALEGPSEE